MRASGTPERAAPDPSRIQDLFLARLEQLEARVREELERPAEAASPTQQLLLDVAREAWMGARALSAALVSPAAFSRRLALLTSGRPVDELGVDTGAAEGLREIVKPFARLWLGLSRVEGPPLPADSGVLVIANRSAWPWPCEALILWTVLCGHAAGRPVHVLWDGRYLEGPFLGDAMSRIGFARADFSACTTLLERGSVVLAFPEGRAALAKTYDRRYRLTRFADAELIEAARATGASVVPAAVVGHEESYAVLGSLLGLPVAPQFPWLGVAGLLPLPLAWRFCVGGTVEYARAEGGDLGSLADALRARMQAMLAEALASRRSIVRG